MIDELKEIEEELDKLKGRVVRLINLLEKRRVRLSVLADEDAIGETADRTIPATHINAADIAASQIADLLGEGSKTKKKGG